jgi:hypothetical protein
MEERQFSEVFSLTFAGARAEPPAASVAADTDGLGLSAVIPPKEQFRAERG